MRLLVIATLLAAVISAGAEEGGERQFPLSDLECTDGSRDDHRVCIFSNLVIYKGRLHFIARDKNTTLPRIRAGFWEVGEAENWVQPVVVTVDELPAGMHSAPIVELTGPRDEVYLWAVWGGFNYGHVIGEYLPSLHATLCKYLGRCTADNTSGLHLLQYYSPPHEQAERQKEKEAAGDEVLPIRWHDRLDEATACFAQQPQLWVNDATIRDKVVTARRVLLGVGDECRARMFCNNDTRYGRFRPISSQMYRGYRRRMGACLGFWAPSAAPVLPRVKILLVDRHYSSGRHILNIEDVLQAVRERYGGIADVELRYMDGLLLREQAQLWNRQSIVVHVHGATLGNWAFLPHNAVAVQIVARPTGSVHDNEFGLQLQRDLHNVSDVTFFPAINPDMHRAHLRGEAVFKQPEWQLLTAEQKVAVLERGNCSSLPASLRDHCQMWWLLKNVDVVISPALITRVLDRAVTALFNKQHLPLPPRHPNGTFIGRPRLDSDPAGAASGADSSGAGSAAGTGAAAATHGGALTIDISISKATSSSRQDTGSSSSGSSVGQADVRGGHVSRVLGGQGKYVGRLVASAAMLAFSALVLHRWSRRREKHWPAWS